MCDYSLEMYRSRPAREGETYRTRRFPAQSIGLTAAGAPETAICLDCGMTLELDGVPAEVRQEFDVGRRETVVFTRIENALHHDAVRFANGAEVALQRLGEGVSVVVVDTLAPRRRETPVRVAELA